MNIYSEAATHDLAKEGPWLTNTNSGAAKNRAYITSNQSVRTLITWS